VTLAEPEHCRTVVERAVEAFGRIDILVSNAAYQMSHQSIEGIPDEEWEYTFRTNISAMFHLCKAALPHMGRGSTIIGSSSVNSDAPNPTLAPYAATKAAIANFCASLRSCSASGESG
jgi:NAD(P)-dependent dehydrogenase (short-subunit alcohol dehydrogenase family)